MFEIFAKLFLSLSIILVPAVVYTDSSDKPPKTWVANFLGACIVGWVVSVFGMIWSA